MDKSVIKVILFYHFSRDMNCTNNYVPIAARTYWEIAKRGFSFKKMYIHISLAEDRGSIPGRDRPEA